MYYIEFLMNENCILNVRQKCITICIMLHYIYKVHVAHNKHKMSICSMYIVHVSIGLYILMPYIK